MNSNLPNAIDLQDLEIETFEIETLSEIGVNAAMAESELDLTVASTSSTCSSSCG